jgi:hypothetical protein
MKKSKLCVCRLCQSDAACRHSENDLHIFVGIHKSNNKCDLHKFQSDFEYKAVLQWDVGYADDPRYYVYFQGEGNAVAWYDVVNEIGYKNSNAVVI